MNATVTDIRIEGAARAVFFNVLFEMGDGFALAIPGWKVVDGKIFPPSKGRGNAYYSVVFSSPKVARLIQDALEATTPEGLELEADAFTSAKWGQSGLKSIFRDEKAAMEVWKRYKNGNSQETSS